ncbi:hypothetical protein D6779_01750 [Candidatus Parcubacteria bacterium]|nr:MAG: hypothetical protein D6779_01750 [Candidatus Parcubacteria bacterium]
MKWLVAGICTTLAVVVAVIGTVVSVWGAGEVTVPTNVTAVAPTLSLSQNAYRWYENANALTPTTPLADESTATSTPVSGTVVRLRMNLRASGLPLSAGAEFKLQYSQSTSSGWADVGTSTPWTFFDNSGVADGQVIVTTVLSSSDVGESYAESNPTAVSPNEIGKNQEGEWDWVLLNSSAARTSSWYFRMVYASGTLLDAYTSYPSFSAVTVTTSTSSTSSGGSVPPNIGFVRKKQPSASTTASSTFFPPPPPVVRPDILIRCDFNGDRVCNIIDLSILLFYYGKSGSQVAVYDLDGSGKVDFPDISILMFYWS